MKHCLQNPSSGIYLAFALLCCTATASQNPYFDNLSIEHGLSQGTIFDIEQDAQGYLWIGTNNGLNRYDGVKFILFGSTHDDPKSPAALTHSTVYDISPDPNGNFWIGTHYGLNFFDTRNYQTKHFLHDPDNPNSLGNNMVRKSLFDPEGRLWLATYDGLDQYNPKTDQFKHYKNEAGSLCSNILRTLIQDRQGYIWLGSSENGLCRFDPTTETFSPLDYRNNPIESATVGIRDLYEDKDNTIWIASTQGLYHYNPTTGKSTVYHANPLDENTLPDDWVQRILPFDDEHFWIGTSDGLSLFNKKTHRFSNFNPSNSNKHSLSKGEILSMLIDRSGLLWIGSNGGGLDKYNPRQTAFQYIGANGKSGYHLSDPAIWEITKAFGYLWISTTKGLNRYDISSGKIKYYLPNPHDENTIVSENIHSITPGDNRDLWLGTQQGLSHFYIDTERFENFRHEVDKPNSLPFNNILTTMLDSSKNLWIGFFGEGVGIYDIYNRKFTHLRHNPEDPDSISHNIVYTIYESSDHHIWLGTANGLNRYDPDKKKFIYDRNYKEKNPTTNAEITSIRGAKNGNILIGSPIGFSIYNPNKATLKTYTKKDGLEDEYIYAVEEDNQGYIWVSTNRGLSRINPKTNEIKNFDVTDGLQGYEFNGTASFNDGKYLYFGGFNGLNYFIPEDIEISTYIPPVTLTHFSTHKRDLNRLNDNETIQLPYQENFFSIEFAVMDFTHTKRNQYAYKLEGFDVNWVYSGNRNFAAYTNLDGGTYTLHVKGANKYGAWNEIGTTLHIEIEAPPWRQWWAYLLYAVTLFLITFFIIRFRTISDAKALADKLRRMSTNLSQTLNLETVQNQLANHLQRIAPHQQIVILIKGQECFSKNTDHSTTPLGNHLNIEEKNHIIKFIDATKHVILLDSPEKFRQLNINYQRWRNINLLILPLVTRDSTLGATILFNHKSLASFREEQINIAFTLCAQASTAIDNAQLFEETKQLAFFDPLTGLANRRLFKERLEQMLKNVRRGNHGLAVMLLDLDQFKRVNDSLGHHIGDLYLQETATRLKQCVRAQDTVARIGGDEFTILLSDVDGFKAATTVAKKILETFSIPINTDNHSINLSTSIGISLAPRDGIDSIALMKNADVALYKAKDSGRNNYQFYTEEMNIKADEHIRMESDLRKALADNEFEMYYQPLINVANGRIEFIEALLRWNHPKKGLLSPAEFISTAEDTGLINALGKYVLHSTLIFAKNLHANQIDLQRILVNLSTKQMQNHLHETITNFLNASELDAGWLGLEVTENTLMEITDDTIKTLHSLKNANIMLAIDNFGIGYSSLSHIKKLPIDLLKIDQSFIRDIPYDKNDIEIITAIIAMAHKLKLKVVAEGVETESQLDFLRKNQCDIAQGFYFNKPMPETAMLAILKEQNQ